MYIHYVLNLFNVSVCLISFRYCMCLPFSPLYIFLSLPWLENHSDWLRSPLPAHPCVVTSKLVSFQYFRLTHPTDMYSSYLNTYLRTAVSSCNHLNLSHLFLFLYLPMHLGLCPNTIKNNIYNLWAIILFPVFVLQGGDGTQNLAHARQQLHPWAPAQPRASILNYYGWLVLNKPPLLDLIVPTYYLLHSFSFLPHLMVTFYHSLPLLFSGRSDDPGAQQPLPLSVNANLFFPSIHLYSPASIQSFFPFQYWFLHLQRAGAPNWIHHNLLLMGLPSIAPLKPSLTYWCLKGLLVGWVIVHLRSTDGN